MADGPVITVRGRRTILTIYARGHAELRYRYATIDARFASPLVNPWNLAFVAQGLYYDESVEDEILIQRVIDGRKPAAFTAGEYVPMEGLRRVATDGGLNARVQPNPFFDDPLSSPYPFALTAARPGTCGDLFDLEACVSDYVRLVGQRHERDLRATLFGIRDVALALLMHGSAPVEWEHSETDMGCVLTGLTLGYPIESTASIILGTNGVRLARRDDNLNATDYRGCTS